MRNKFKAILYVGMQLFGFRSYSDDLFSSEYIKNKIEQGELVPIFFTQQIGKLNNCQLLASTNWTADSVSSLRPNIIVIGNKSLCKKEDIKMVLASGNWTVDKKVDD